MKYEDFTECVRAFLEKMLIKEEKVGDVVIREVIKNNNVRLKAVSIVKNDNMAIPTIYLNSYYEEYNEGRDVDLIAREIYDLFFDKTKYIKFNKEEFTNFDKVKDNIAFKVINYKYNKERLKQIPYIKILDLAIVLFVVIASDNDGIATAMINKSHLDLWDISDDKIKEIAFENTPNIYPARIQKMEDVIAELIMNDIDKDIEDSGVIKEEVSYGNYTYEQIESTIKEEIDNIKADKEIEMFVLTNESKVNGASTMFYDDILKRFSDEHNSDIYIIPSSIHEVLLIPNKGNWTKRQINEMIVEVNSSQLDPVEVLSDYVYIYRREDNKLHV